jgi:hypothetical protein
MDNYEDIKELLAQDNVSVLVNYRPGAGLIATLKDHAKNELNANFSNIHIEDFAINLEDKSDLSKNQFSLIDAEVFKQVKALSAGSNYLIAVQGLEYMTQAGQNQLVEEIKALQKEASVKVVYAVNNPAQVADVFFDICENCYRGYDLTPPANLNSKSQKINAYPDGLKEKLANAINGMRQNHYGDDKESSNNNKFR